MRDELIKAIIEIMQQDKSVFFLTGDLGYNAVEPIEIQFPERFVNCGIAEQNMIGVAAGLALTGKKVYLYSIIPFVTMRCFEQIRNDICFHNLDVTIIGMGGGLTYGVLGKSHYAIEDIGILQTLPKMKIVCPCDGIEAGKLVKKLYEAGGPSYIRLGKSQVNICSDEMDLVLSRPNVIKEGDEVIVFSYGDILEEVVTACDILKKNGVGVEVVDMHTIKPVDNEAVMDLVGGKKLVVVVEEHKIFGGLGSVLATILASGKGMPRLKILALPDELEEKFGSVKYSRNLYGLSAEKMAEKVMRELK